LAGRAKEATVFPTPNTERRTPLFIATSPRENRAINVV
jgi:hypothetical protein